MLKGCGDCNQASTLAETIGTACKQLASGHLGVAAMYDMLAANAIEPVARVFREAAAKHKKLAHDTVTDITVPEEADLVPQQAEAAAQ